MPNGVVVLEQLLVTEDWELGRQVLIESSTLAEERREVEDRFEVRLESLESILDLPDASLKQLKEEILVKVEAKVREYNSDLYQKICVELDYCNNKDSWKWRAAEYTAAVLDIAFGGGGVALGVLLLKREYFDKLCKCKK
jgi:hypothetical protein